MKDMYCHGYHMWKRESALEDLPQQTRINLVKVKRSSGGTRGGAGGAAP